MRIRWKYEMMKEIKEGRKKGGAASERKELEEDKEV